MSSGKTSLFAIGCITQPWVVGLKCRGGTVDGSLAFESLLLLLCLRMALRSSPGPARSRDTRPCFRFFGVVLNTHQSPIWIKPLDGSS